MAKETHEKGCQVRLIESDQKQLYRKGDCRREVS